MILKTYISRYPKFSVGIVLGKKKEDLQFNHRSIEPKGVKFKTSNEAIQEALEKLDSFGVHFRLLKSEELPDPVIEEETNQEQDKDTEPENELEQGAETKEVATEPETKEECDEETTDVIEELIEPTEPVVPETTQEPTEEVTPAPEAVSEEVAKPVEFSTVQDAKTWLNKEKGIAMNKLLNKTQVLAEAEGIGITIVFKK